MPNLFESLLKLAKLRSESQPHDTNVPGSLAKWISSNQLLRGFYGMKIYYYANRLVWSDA